MTGKSEDVSKNDGQHVSQEELDAVVEGDRKQIISAFAASMGAYNEGVLSNFTAALANFETTVLTASTAEAQPAFASVLLSTALEEGFKELNKQVFGSVAFATGAIFAFAKNLKKETDRAAASGISHSIGDWIKNVRSGTHNAYTACGSAQVLLRAAVNTYLNAGSEEERQALIDDFSFATAAVDEGTWAIAPTEIYERSLYEGWINDNFTIIGRVDDDISGFIDVRFENGDLPKSTAVVSPLGDKIGDALNRVAAPSGAATMVDLRVHKRVCKWARNAIGGSGWSCGWYDGTNALINEPNSEEVTAFLKNGDWMRSVTLFK